MLNRGVEVGADDMGGALALVVVPRLSLNPRSRTAMASTLRYLWRSANRLMGGSVYIFVTNEKRVEVRLARVEGRNLNVVGETNTIWVDFCKSFFEVLGGFQGTILVLVSSPTLPYGPCTFRRERGDNLLEKRSRIWGKRGNSFNTS